MPYGETTAAEMDAAHAAGLKVVFSLKDIFFGSSNCPPEVIMIVMMVTHTMNSDDGDIVFMVLVNRPLLHALDVSGAVVKGRRDVLQKTCRKLQRPSGSAELLHQRRDGRRVPPEAAGTPAVVGRG